MKAAGLDFVVHRENAYAKLPTEPIANNPSYPMGTLAVHDVQLPMYANVRDTDNEVLGCVTPQYSIIQNKDAFALMDAMLAVNTGSITHAGMTDDGLCFMVGEIEPMYISSEAYIIGVMVTNSFNAKYPCSIILSPVRIICQNMYRKLSKDVLLRLMHTSSANARLSAFEDTGQYSSAASAFKAEVLTYQMKHMSVGKLHVLINHLFPYPKEFGVREEMTKERIDRMREEFSDVYYDAPDNVPHHGTAFAFANAYMDYLSHRPATRNLGNWDSRRLSGLVSANDVKVNVLREALK